MVYSFQEHSLMILRILFPFWKYASRLPHYHLERVNLRQANITSSEAVQGPGQFGGLIQPEPSQRGHKWPRGGAVYPLSELLMGPCARGRVKGESLGLAPTSGGLSDESEAC